MAGRIVSPPEAVYRLFEYKMKGRSHSVQILPVHLPDMQPVYFDAGAHDIALDQARSKTTKLKAFFRLNEIDPNARQFLYSEIPIHYTWQTRAPRRAANRQDADDDDDGDGGSDGDGEEGDRRWRIDEACCRWIVL